MLLDQIKDWFKSPYDHREAQALYGSIVAQSRRPAFYESYGVPDTPDGRFDLVAVHAFLVMRRLRCAGAAGQALSQALFDLMFADFDQNMREMGVGDHGMPKRMKRLTENFMGRVGAYDAGLEAGGAGDLAKALERNLYRKTDVERDVAAAMADYVRQADGHLAAQDDDALLAGAVDLDIAVGPDLRERHDPN